MQRMLHTFVSYLPVCNLTITSNANRYLFYICEQFVLYKLYMVGCIHLTATINISSLLQWQKKKCKLSKWKMIWNYMCLSIFKRGRGRGVSMEIREQNSELVNNQHTKFSFYKPCLKWKLLVGIVHTFYLI